jgi:signal transduction histidine kinase
MWACLSKATCATASIGVCMYGDWPPPANLVAWRDEPLDSAWGLPSGQQGIGMRPLRAAAAIWLSYLLVLIAADYAAARTSPATHLLPGAYYLSQVLIALAVLALSLFAWPSARLGRAFLPSLFVCMAALPMIATAATVPSLQPGPLIGVGGAIMLRTLPMLTVVVVLIAWLYRLRHIMLFCMGTAALFTLLQLRLPLNPVKVATLAIVQGMGLLVLGYCASLLMEKLRTQQASLEQANRQLRHYANTLEHLAMSRERNRVARELHDTLAHTLSGMVVQLEATKACLAIDHQSTGAMIQIALDSARSGLQETRRALQSLRASPLDQLGLGPAVQQLAEQAAETGVQLDCAISAELPALAPEVEQCLYRVAQEAIANVTQHANASLLRVHLSHTRGQLRLLVQDDGHGFERRPTPGDGHFGLAGMAERATLCGARLTITSATGAGTTVLLAF